MNKYHTSSENNSRNCLLKVYFFINWVIVNEEGSLINLVPIRIQDRIRKSNTRNNKKTDPLPNGNRVSLSTGTSTG